MKNELRKKYLEIRNSITEKDRKIKSNIIFKKLIENEYYKSAEKILIYKSMGSEVITDNIINHSLSLGKKVALPYVIKEKKEMIFIEINFESKFILSKFNIQEPEFSDEMLSDKNSLIVVPAIAFDKYNFRIGYGGGYYDKYLKDSENLSKIGICYSEQIIDEIKKESFDIAVDFVLTDN